jgi:hypothetical protein
MSNLAEKLIEPVIDRTEDELVTVIHISSGEYDCTSSYMLSKYELENNLAPSVIALMTLNLHNYIKEKLNATREGKES